MRRNQGHHSLGGSCFKIGLAGVALTGFPVIWMLVTGIAGSVMSGKILADVLLPAELFFLTLPGMILVAAAALRRKFLKRTAVTLFVIAVAALVLCQGTAAISGIASGRRPAQGFIWYLLAAFLACYDLAAVASVIAGIAVVRKCRR